MTHAVAPTAEDETWEVQVPGRIWLKRVAYNRQMQAVVEDYSIGPNKQGTRVRIAPGDRELVQAEVADPRFDPFRSGLLTRVDTSQQLDPATASVDALSNAELSEVFDLEGEPFRLKLMALGRIPLARVRAMADGMGATNRQVTAINEVWDVRMKPGQMSSGDQELSLSGERSSNPNAGTIDGER